MNTERLYPLVEHFATFQGEGVHMGRPAYFLRLYGCDQKCSFCDAAATWHPDYRPVGIGTYTALQLAELVRAPIGAIVVLTGGEPTLYSLEPVIAAIHKRGYLVHLETAGHHAIPANVDWVTLSPKPFASLPLPESIERADEFKIIVSDRRSLADGLAAIQKYRRHAAPIWLHPEWSCRNDPEVLRLIAETVKHGREFRAGWQLHKLYHVDALDPFSDKRPVPLGGNPDHGPSI